MLDEVEKRARPLSEVEVCTLLSLFSKLRWLKASGKLVDEPGAINDIAKEENAMHSRVSQDQSSVKESGGFAETS